MLPHAVLEALLNCYQKYMESVQITAATTVMTTLTRDCNHFYTERIYTLSFAAESAAPSF